MNPLRRIWEQLRQTVDSGPPPAWAGFFSPAQYQRFLGLVRAHFDREGLSYRLGDGIVHLDQALGGCQQLGLLNLAQNCAHNDEKEWSEIIDSHFRLMAKSHREHEVLQDRVAAFDRVAELLSVRLWPESYLHELGGDKIIHRIDLPGTITALVFDLPSSIRNVTPQEAEGWGKTREELFEVGLANLRENCIPDVNDQDLGEAVTITLYSDESFFVASHALLLGDHGESLGAFGALVGIPHRHVLLTYPINDLRILPAIHRLIPIIQGMERDGPGSLTRRLYWYRDGRFTDLPYELD